MLKTFLKSVAVILIAGGLIGALSIKVFAERDWLSDDRLQQLQVDLIGKVEYLVNNYCDTMVSFPFRYPRSYRRCPRLNEVMSGMDDNYLYCSTITVRCFRDEAEQRQDSSRQSIE